MASRFSQNVQVDADVCDEENDARNVEAEARGVYLIGRVRIHDTLREVRFGYRLRVAEERGACLTIDHEWHLRAKSRLLSTSIRNIPHHVAIFVPL